MSYLFLRGNNRISRFLSIKIGNIHVVVLTYSDPTGSSSAYPYNRLFLHRSQVFAAVLK